MSYIVILMGSKNDWDTMKPAVDICKHFGVSYEAKVLSAHRTPHILEQYLKEKEEEGLQVIIAGAGGAAHLAGVCAAHSVVPVLGVPIDSSPLNGMDALLATVQMPSGIPVGTLSIGSAGAKNAALLAIAILANNNSDLKQALLAFRKEQADKVLASSLE